MADTIVKVDIRTIGIGADVFGGKGECPSITDRSAQANIFRSRILVQRDNRIRKGTRTGSNGDLSQGIAAFLEEYDVVSTSKVRFASTAVTGGFVENRGRISSREGGIVGRGVGGSHSGRGDGHIIITIGQPGRIE